jgi:hypothetical protein
MGLTSTAFGADASSETSSDTDTKIETQPETESLDNDNPQVEPAKSPLNSGHAPTKKTTNRKRDEDVFRPSEEISEDFAVSFPVDI